MTEEALPPIVVISFAVDCKSTVPALARTIFPLTLPLFTLAPVCVTLPFLNVVVASAAPIVGAAVAPAC